MKCRHGGIVGLTKGILIGMIAASVLTGCGNRIPEMSEEQEQAVGEYAAMLLLKYDANHRSRLVDLSTVPEEDAIISEIPEEALNQESDQMKPVADTPVIDQTGENGTGNAGSIEELLGLPEGVVLSYRGMEVCNSYPEDGQADTYFALEASKGKRLLVLDFALSNQSPSEQSVDVLHQEAVFYVTVNGNYKRGALVTLLMDDLSTYMGSIEAGGEKQLVLLVEIENDMADAVSSISLNVKNESKEYTIQLQ